MSRKYDVIDADSHLLEPLDLWKQYLDPKFRDRAPEVFIDTDGKDRLRIEGKIIGGERGIGMAGAVGARQGEVSMNIHYEEGRKGGFDPHARIADMDMDGIDATFIYPTLGLYAGVVEDPKLAANVCRAYNRYLAEFCSAYPDRLFGVAMLPMQDVGLAIEEMRFARETLGFKSGFIRPNRYLNRKLDDRAYFPFWEVAQDLDFPLGVHEGAGGMPAVGADRYKTWAEKHIVGHTMEMMLACLALIWGGVCERYPRLRFAFLESGGGWIAPWLDRMDRHFEHEGLNTVENVGEECVLKIKPSDYFRRQCFISFEPVEGCLGALAEYIGPNKILWATDYPHSDGFFPGAAAMIRKLLPNPETSRQVLAEGAKQYYGLR
jgi:predicted TIM-barrel fold metal-dependent hydrolase